MARIRNPEQTPMAEMSKVGSRKGGGKMARRGKRHGGRHGKRK